MGSLDGPVAGVADPRVGILSDGLACPSGGRGSQTLRTQLQHIYIPSAARPILAMELLKGGHQSLKNSILLHDKYKPALYIYMLQRIQIPPTPMSAVVITVNTTAGNPMLIPVGPSQSAGTVRLINVEGTVTFTDARQAAAYAVIGVSNTGLHKGMECTYH